MVVAVRGEQSEVASEQMGGECQDSPPRAGGGFRPL
jgi:hypothetical protein